MTFKKDWTNDPEACQLLTRLWDEGLSARQIAKEIGGVTANAVIGRANRMGLLPRLSPIKRLSNKGLTLFQLTRETCRFPIGDPGQEGFYFCGDQVEKRPYCPHHYRMAYYTPK